MKTKDGRSQFLGLSIEYAQPGTFGNAGLPADVAEAAESSKLSAPYTAAGESLTRFVYSL